MDKAYELVGRLLAEIDPDMYDRLIEQLEEEGAL